MSDLESRAKTFGNVVRDILKQFQVLHSPTACGASGIGPHANLGHQDIRVLEYLGDSGPQMMRSVAEHLGLAVNSTTSIVDSLEQKGIAQRTRSSTDRRVIYVELTESGRSVYSSVSEAKLQFHRALLGALSEDEQEILLVLFRKIAREGVQQVERLHAREASGLVAQARD